MTRRPGLPDYERADLFPRRVWAAVEASRANDFPLACVPEVGQLLELLTSLRGIQVACELGSAYGVGAAWIHSGLRADASLTTVELDPGRASATAALFADDPRVEVLTGDWSLALNHGPFDLLFSDGGPKRSPGDPEKLAQLIRIGGLVILDDYTPPIAWSAAQREKYSEDTARSIWFESEIFRARELVVRPDQSVILAVRTR